MSTAFPVLVCFIVSSLGHQILLVARPSTCLRIRNIKCLPVCTLMSHMPDDNRCFRYAISPQPSRIKVIGTEYPLFPPLNNPTIQFRLSGGTDKHNYQLIEYTCTDVTITDGGWCLLFSCINCCKPWKREILLVTSFSYYKKSPANAGLSIKFI